MEQQELFVNMALNAWNMQISRTAKFFDAVSDEDLLKQVAPGKNSIAYLMGHLVAVNDNIISLFGIGERSYAHLDEAYVKNADRSGLATIEPPALRELWKKSNAELSAYFSRMPLNDWLTKHTAMSDEDFIKDPSRNKLSVLMNRTGHVAYHLGQLVLAR